MTTATEPELFSTGDLAERFAVSIHCVATVARRLGIGQFVGRNRAIKAEDVGRIEAGLRAAGYLDRPSRHGGKA